MIDIYDKLELADVYNFMQTGSPANAPAEIVEYLDTLDSIRGMLIRIDQFSSENAIIKHLIIQKKIPRVRAMQLIQETKEYFYKDDQVSKEAYKNLYAQKMDRVINFAMKTMKDVKDEAAVVKMLRDVAETRGVFEKDEEKLDEGIFNKPYRLYSLDARVTEFNTNVSRISLGQIIDAIPDITELQKDRLKEEALIETLNLFPDDKKNTRKKG